MCAMTAVAALALSACGASGTASNGGGEGVEADASIEEYQAAFADVEPITIYTQTGGPQGSRLSLLLEEYFAAVDEWSDGKLQFEVEFSNAVAAPPEADDAVQDGRLDLAPIFATYDPDSYPALNSLLDLTFTANQSPLVGPLQLSGWMTEVSASDPGIVDEYEASGLYPLVPIYHAGLDSLFCSEPRTSLDDLDGASSRATSRVQVDQLAALGMESVSLDFTEAFEGLQRGAVDCINAGPLSATVSGILEVAPHATIDPEAGFGVGSGSIVMNRDVWDSLPLVAQQLLHDRLDVFFQYQLDGAFGSYAEMIETITAAGGGTQPFESDAREALLGVNEDLLDEARDNPDHEDPSAFVDTVLDSSDRWYDAVTKDLEYDVDLSPEEFAEWYDDKGPDTWAEFADLLMRDALADQRPS